MLKQINKKDTKALREYLSARTQEISTDILQKVNTILQDVRSRGDEAVRAYTKDFDRIDISQFRVSQEEIDAAAAQCDPVFCQAMMKAKENIEFFHRAQVQNSYLQQKEMGIYLGQRVLPLSAVGI